MTELLKQALQQGTDSAGTTQHREELQITPSRLPPADMGLMLQAERRVIRGSCF